MRTAQRFVTYILDGEFDKANELLVPPAKIKTVSGVGKPSYGKRNIRTYYCWFFGCVAKLPYEREVDDPGAWLDD